MEKPREYVFDKAEFAIISHNKVVRYFTFGFHAFAKSSIAKPYRNHQLTIGCRNCQLERLLIIRLLMTDVNPLKTIIII